MATRIRRDDTVRVTAGKDRGKTGKVLRVDRAKDRVYIEGMNMRKRHQRPHPMGDTQRSGGVIESEGPIHASNVMLVDPETGQPTRIGIRRENGRPVRVSRRSGKPID